MTTWKVSRPLALALIAVGAVLAWNAGLFALVMPNVAHAKCTVGYAGSALSVTIDGLGALAQYRAYVDDAAGEGRWYVYDGSQQPQGAVICQVTQAGRLVTVRDEGALNLLGNEVCQQLIAGST